MVVVRRELELARGCRCMRLAINYPGLEERVSRGSNFITTDPLPAEMASVVVSSRRVSLNDHQRFPLLPTPPSSPSFLTMANLGGPPALPSLRPASDSTAFAHPLVLSPMSRLQSPSSFCRSRSAMSSPSSSRLARPTAESSLTVGPCLSTEA